MIVKHKEEGWEIISHYAHGLLSGKIAQELKINLRPAHWVDVLTGIIEHDDHLLDFDEQEYLTENGTPKDFTMEGGSDREALEHAKRVYANAMQKSQLVALMVGRHLSFLYNSLSKEYSPMKKFLEELDELRTSQRKLYSMNKGNENALYDIMLFCDRLSLILCQNETPQVGRQLEINKTIEKKRYAIFRKDNGSLCIDPWPFQEKEFQLDFEYRILKNPTYQDNKELKLALDKAEIRIRSCCFEK